MPSIKGTASISSTHALQKQLRSTTFPANFIQKVNIGKVHRAVLTHWIETRVEQILGFEDEIVSSTAVHLFLPESNAEDGLAGDDGVDNWDVDPRRAQLDLAGFLGEKEAATFASELWTMMLDAQRSPSGIPKILVERKKEEMRRQREETQQKMLMAGMARGRNTTTKTTTNMGGGPMSGGGGGNAEMNAFVREASRRAEAARAAILADGPGIAPRNNGAPAPPAAAAAARGNETNRPAGGGVVVGGPVPVPPSPSPPRGGRDGRRDNYDRGVRRYDRNDDRGRNWGRSYESEGPPRGGGRGRGNDYYEDASSRRGGGGGGRRNDGYYIDRRGKDLDEFGRGRSSVASHASQADSGKESVDAVDIHTYDDRYFLDPEALRKEQKEKDNRPRKEIEMESACNDKYIDSERSMGGDRILEKMERLLPNSVSCNKQICASAKNGNINEALDLLSAVEAKYLETGNVAIRPNVSTYTLVIKALSKSEVNPQRTQDVLDQIDALNDITTSDNLRIDVDCVCYNAVMDAWGWSSAPDKVQRANKLFHRMLELYKSESNLQVKPNVVTLNSLLNACAFARVKGGEGHAAALLEVATNAFEMFADGEFGSANSLTYFTMLKIFNKFLPMNDDRTEKMKNMFYQCRKNGYLDKKVFRQLEKGIPANELKLLLGDGLSIGTSGNVRMDKHEKTIG